MWICHITIVICHTSSSECVTKQMLPSSSIYDIHTVHTVSSCQFLSGFEGILTMFFFTKTSFWQKSTGNQIYSWFFYILILNPCIHIIGAKIFISIWWNSVTYDRQYLNTYRFENSKSRKVKSRFEFNGNICQNINSFCKQNCMLRMYSKPTEFTENRTEIYKNFKCAVRGRA
jgi:hypothetical protein